MSCTSRPDDSHAGVVACGVVSVFSAVVLLLSALDFGHYRVARTVFETADGIPVRWVKNIRYAMGAGLVDEVRRATDGACG